MFLLAVFTLLLWPQHGFPTPVPARSNSTFETSGWRSEPATRGTFRLLFSCITTLTTCVYTAVHLNVPKKGTTNLARYQRKAAWVMLGIIAPEFVVYTAWAQWYFARKLLVDINRVMDEKMKNHSASRGPFEHETWTMTHAFYAGMGGFVIDTKPTDGKEYIRGCPRLTVTPRGIQFLALNGIIPHVSKSSIKDKSKANAFAKIFTCTQGSWLIVQCISRLCYKLPNTLLEINTVGHVLCALAIYCFWFSKPLDIDEPTVISGQTLPSLCALMWMNSSISSTGIIRPPESKGDETELGGLLFNTKSILTHGDIITGSHRDELATENPMPSQQSTTAMVSPNVDDNHVILLPKQVLQNTGFGLNPIAVRFLKKKKRGTLPQAIELELIDIQRWKMASQVLQSTPSLLGKECFKIPNLGEHYQLRWWKFKELVCDQAEDWPGKDLVGGETTLLRLGEQVVVINRLALFLPLATAAYGGLHAAAWNSYFPTTFERNCWRYSSVAIAASGSVFISLLMLLRIPDPPALGKRAQCFHLVMGIVFVSLIGIILLAVLPIAFIASRVALVIESFITLRELPVAAYDTPRWLQEIPHI